MKSLYFAASVFGLIATILISFSIESASAASLRGKHASEGITCKDCHKTSTPTTAATEQSCMECHGTYDKIAALTKHLHGNPHNSHLGQMECNKCHGIHKPTVIPCLDCHAEFEFKAK
jgi:DnaJ-class molecular chaperone